MRLLKRVLTVLGAGTVVLGVAATGVQADSSGRATPLVNPETGGYYAEYDGKLIDLSQGWQGASVCVEQSDTSMVCYDDEADYRTGEGLRAAGDGLGVMAKSDCRSAYLCLWDNREYAATRIEFRQAGRKYLENYGFAERANSYFNNRETVSGLFDNQGSSGAHTLEAGPGGSRADLGAYYEGRGDGTNWNNKIDELLLTSL